MLTSLTFPPAWSQWLAFVSQTLVDPPHNLDVLMSVDNGSQVYFARKNLLLQYRRHSILPNQCCPLI
jgi:hypothetical protein